MAAGKLAENIMHFARVLRAAGLPIGPDRVIDALQALETAGIARREDFYWTLAAVFLSSASSRNCSIRPSTFSGATRGCRAHHEPAAAYRQPCGPAGQVQASRRLAEALHPEHGQGNKAKRSSRRSTSMPVPLLLPRANCCSTPISRP